MTPITPWLERLLNAHPELRGQWPEGSGAYDELGSSFKDAEIEDLREALGNSQAINRRLVKALQLMVDRFEPMEHEYLFSKRDALRIARAALKEAEEDK